MIDYHKTYHISFPITNFPFQQHMHIEYIILSRCNIPGVGVSNPDIVDKRLLLSRKLLKQFS